MKILVILATLLLAFGLAKAQKIYTVKYVSQADIKIYVVKYESQADLKIFKVKYESQAGENDGKWFFVDYESKAKKKIFFVEYESQADYWYFLLNMKVRLDGKTTPRNI